MYDIMVDRDLRQEGYAKDNIEEQHNVEVELHQGYAARAAASSHRQQCAQRDHTRNLPTRILE
jgi:hypothetical protein